MSGHVDPAYRNERILWPGLIRNQLSFKKNSLFLSHIGKRDADIASLFCVCLSLPILS